jgi:hypothetical protein
MARAAPEPTTKFPAMATPDWLNGTADAVPGQGRDELWERTRVHANRGTTVGRALLECRPVQIVDVRADPDYAFDEAQKIFAFRRPSEFLRAALAQRAPCRGRIPIRMRWDPGQHTRRRCIRLFDRVAFGPRQPRPICRISDWRGSVRRTPRGTASHPLGLPPPPVARSLHVRAERVRPRGRLQDRSVGGFVTGRHADRGRHARGVQTLSLGTLWRAGRTGSM